jgi:hypothetical protein
MSLEGDEDNLNQTAKFLDIRNLTEYLLNGPIYYDNMSLKP